MLSYRMRPQDCVSECSCCVLWNHLQLKCVISVPLVSHNDMFFKEVFTHPRSHIDDAPNLSSLVVAWLNWSTEYASNRKWLHEPTNFSVWAITLYCMTGIGLGAEALGAIKNWAGPRFSWMFGTPRTHFKVNDQDRIECSRIQTLHIMWWEVKNPFYMHNIQYDENYVLVL